MCQINEQPILAKGRIKLYYSATMKKQKLYNMYLFVPLFVLLSALSSFVHAEAAMPVIGPEVGNMIPDFTLPDLSGKKIAFSSFRGKKVILYHWATWCTCRYQVPLLQKFYEQNKKKNVVLVTVAYDSEGEKHVKPFIKKNNITVPVLVERTLYLAAVLNFKSTQNARSRHPARLLPFLQARKPLDPYFQKDFLLSPPPRVSRSQTLQATGAPPACSYQTFQATFF